MKINYDPKADSLFFELAKGIYERSKKISEDILVDYDKKGKILGIEIIAAKENIKSFIPGKISLTKKSVNFAR